MLKQHSQWMVTGLAIADALAVSVAWLASYWIRFNWLPVDPAKGVPDLSDRFLPLLPLVVLAHLIIFYRLRLYRPRRAGSLPREARDILKAFVAAVVVVILIDYAIPASNKISRQFIATYAVVGTTCFALFRLVMRVFLRAARRRGWNARTAAIVGSGRNAQRLVHALQRNSWTGIQVLYFVDDREDEQSGRVRDIPVRGPMAELRRIVEQTPVDSVFIALPSDQANRTEQVLAALSTTMADVRLVPEINPTYAMRPNVSQLDGIPILSLRQTPLYGWNAILKRAFDLVVGALCLLIALVPMALLALLIKLNSRGPVFYLQRRMGLDGREFRMFKFRTMRADAEAETGAVWAERADPRRTWIGAFLRRTSLDELPNLFNVLAGQMSLVGPRPERPEFIERFKEEIPRYMLRHKMKAGMTGYAQVRGLRGNTSLRKRIQHDVHYIRNWSLMLDLRILARTVTGVWFSKHET
ncbi:MAG: undecaprenyl-phosphate glucose phosphotransferase [Planctomycetes bacterium]|nr:undecaprenyl-phosphate glucose phosphotransferase [Planctomycetota bacterium]